MVKKKVIKKTNKKTISKTRSKKPNPKMEVKKKAKKHLGKEKQEKIFPPTKNRQLKSKTTKTKIKGPGSKVVNLTSKPIFNEIKLALAISKKMVEKLDVPRIEEVR